MWIRSALNVIVRAIDVALCCGGTSKSVRILREMTVEKVVFTCESVIS